MSSAAIPLVEQPLGAEPHHRLGAAQEGGGAIRVQPQPGQRLGDEPDLPGPACRGLVDGQVHLEVRAAGPGVQFPAEQEFGLRPGAGDQADPAVSVPLGQRPEDDGPERGQPDPARHDHQVAPGGRRQVPGRAERPADAEDRPGRASCRARLTAPTARIVCSRPASPAGGTPLAEIATSPIRGAASIENWPGCAAGSRSPTGSSRRVTESCGLRPAAHDPVGHREHRLAGEGPVRAGHQGPGTDRAAGPGWPAGGGRCAPNSASIRA